MLYPQQNDRRNLLDLSGIWDFQIDPDEVGEAEGWFNDLADARPMAVPSSWNDIYDDIRDYLGMAWYVTETYVPAGWADEKVMLRVGSTNYAAKVWVNGTFAGGHEGGHLPFEFDVTGLVRWDAPNTIAVQVENHLRPNRVPAGNVEGGIAAFMRMFPAATFDFFPYAGLHRAVQLYSLPQSHIQDVTVTTGIDGADGVVTVAVKANGAANGRIRLGDQTASLAFDNGTAQAQIRVADARLWGPDDPYLYPLTVTLGDDAAPLDRYALDVGIRTIAVDGGTILLNGQPIFLKGFGKHEDFAVSGRGQFNPLLVKDYALLKWIGANSYRTAHYPYSEEEMRMSEREGILIIDEIPNVSLQWGGGDEAVAERLRMCKQQMNELIARDKNHPSVVMWSIANEPMPEDMMQRMAAGSAAPPPIDPATTAFFQELYDLCRAQDPTRLVTLVGVMGGPVEWMAPSDVVCINRYYGWYAQSGQMEEGQAALAQELDALYAQLGKPMIVTEFGADTLPGNHSHPPAMWSEEYQVEFIRRYLDTAAERPFMTGMHIWNFADFKTAQGIMRAASMNHKGVFTRERQPKMAAHFLHERWNQPGSDKPGS
jgi:beta-glucuronidase